MNDYCPGATQSPQSGGVTLDLSLPPRGVWHITWDVLDAYGHQPQMSAVGRYLERMGYCPHILWNPFTGEIIQYYPASVGGRALMYNNQDGTACVQIEVFFTPGCIVDGVKYNTVAETPCVGLEGILEWTDSLGIPRVWPMGPPQWTGNLRDVNIWNGNAGHYGHCNSPGDSHTDPGPMPDLNSQGDNFLMALTDAEQKRILAWADRGNGVVPDPTAQILTTKHLGQIADAVLDDPSPLAGGGETTPRIKVTYMKQEFNVLQNMLAEQKAQIIALAGVIAAGSTVTKEEILAQLDSSVKSTLGAYVPTFEHKDVSDSAPVTSE